MLNDEGTPDYSSLQVTSKKSIWVEPVWEDGYVAKLDLMIDLLLEFVVDASGAKIDFNGSDKLFVPMTLNQDFKSAFQAYYGPDIPLVDGMPTASWDGYTFLGWTDKNGNRVTGDWRLLDEYGYIEAQELTPLNEIRTITVTLYAQWQQNHFVTFCEKIRPFLLPILALALPVLAIAIPVLGLGIPFMGIAGAVLGGLRIGGLALGGLTLGGIVAGGTLLAVGFVELLEIGAALLLPLVALGLTVLGVGGLSIAAIAALPPLLLGGAALLGLLLFPLALLLLLVFPAIIPLIPLWWPLILVI